MFYEEKSCFSLPQILEVISVIRQTHMGLLQTVVKESGFQTTPTHPKREMHFYCSLTHPLKETLYKTVYVSL